MKGWRDVLLGGSRIRNLGYADDTTVTTTNENNPHIVAKRKNDEGWNETLYSKYKSPGKK